MASYTDGYGNSYTLTNSDATNVGKQMMTNANAITSGGGTFGAGSFPSGTNTHAGVVAIADAIVARLGYQGSSDQNATSNSTYGGSGLATFADVTNWPTWTTPSIAVAGTYVLHAHLWFYISTAAGKVQFRTVLDGTPQTALASQYRFCYTAAGGNTWHISWSQPLTLSIGTHTLSLQVATDSGMTMGANTDSPRAFLLS